MKTIIGRRLNGSAIVTVKSEQGEKALMHYPVHSPDGFEWGYGGSGPADLAYAILTEVAGQTVASEYYQDFKWLVVSSLPHEGFELSEAAVRKCIGRLQGKAPSMVAQG